MSAGLFRLGELEAVAVYVSVLLFELLIWRFQHMVLTYARDLIMF